MLKSHGMVHRWLPYVNNLSVQNLKDRRPHLRQDVANFSNVIVVHWSIYRNILSTLLDNLE